MAPRVEISYEIEAAGGVEQRQLPFVLGVLADLEGQQEYPTKPFSDRKFVEIHTDNFDDVFGSIQPRLVLSIENRSTPVTFRCLDDFAPHRVARQIPQLRDLLDLRRLLADLRGILHARRSIDDAVRDAVLRFLGPDPAEKREQFDERTEDAVGALFEELGAGRMPLARSNDAMIGERLAAIDETLSAQLNQVFHHPDFRRLEASWRGLHRLVCNTATSPSMKIRVLAVSKNQLQRDFRREPEMEQTQLFRLICEEYSFFGGQPFGALIGDYEFDKSPEDIHLLQDISGVAALAQAPFIAGAAPAMFNLDTFADLGAPRDLTKIFDTSEYTHWKSFRNTKESRFAGLVLPHVLRRLPYGRSGLQSEGFVYDEGLDAGDPEKLLWGNPAYEFGERLTAAFANYAWCAAIVGREQGGLVTDLPLGSAGPTAIAIADRRREEIVQLGFIPLCQEKGTNRAVFFDAVSCQKGARAQMNYLLATSRFCHYIRVIFRDRAGMLHSRVDWERYLNEWLTGYVLLEDAHPEVKARFPLREGRVGLLDVPGRPGVFRVFAHLRPHFQLPAPETAFVEDLGPVVTG
jgi:type VI secretion system protein ImpC